jgi:predicted amidophosphoribosyltransferase
MLPAMFAQYFGGQKTGGRPDEPAPAAACPECRSSVPGDSKFCAQCGHQMVVFSQCSRCGKNLAPNAKFCPRCGLATETAPQKKFCPHCGAENLADSIHCNECGEKL